VILKKFLPKLTGYLIKFFLKLIFKTCTFKVKDIGIFFEEAKKGSLILALWHEHIVVIPEFLYTYANFFSYVALVSNSRDGEILATITNSYKKARALRVKHNAKGPALKAMIDVLTEEKNILIMTPDGPRGPKHQIKQGLVIAAKKSNCPVMSFSWKASHVWKLNSWDQMQIPKPFSTIEISFKKSFYFKEGSLEETKALEKDMLFNCGSKDL
jgi:lysophospholipid acyltransferase (LPLAT)-like uncharacterized protein